MIACVISWGADAICQSNQSLSEIFNQGITTNSICFSCSSNFSSSNDVSNINLVFGTCEKGRVEKDTVSGNILAFSGLSTNSNEILFNANRLHSSSSSTLLSLLYTRDDSFCFMFYDNASDVLWFGVDCFNRRSLTLQPLFSNSSSHQYCSGIVISSSSCCCSKECIEVTSEAIFSMRLQQDDQHTFVFKKHTRNSGLSIISLFNSGFMNSQKYFNQQLLSTFFTGEKTRNKKREEKTCVKTREKKRKKEEKNDVSTTISPHSDIFSSVDYFLACLSNAVKRLVQLASPSHQTLPYENSVHGKDIVSSPVSILFSGGLDSSVIAALVSQHLPSSFPIDLINVSYFSTNGGIPPDRIAAMNALLELQTIYPLRTWRLIFIDIKSSDLDEFSNSICCILHPQATIMDFNIGAVFFFAALGRGRVVNATSLNNQFVVNNAVRYSCSLEEWHYSPYTLVTDETEITNIYNNIELSPSPFLSSARMVFVGSGADEFLCGYSRHRSTYKHYGITGLKEELKKDQIRMSCQLARQFRVFSFFDREAVYPFLDSQVVKLVSDLPIQSICDLSLPFGIGDKALLRQVAYKLGLRFTSFLQKRAIQFGTRVATRKIPGTVLLTELDLKEYIRNR